MSDSDSELLTNNVFTFQNESTTVSARGPNINTSNLTGISFQNNVLTSTMNMPRIYEWQRRAESNYDQRSIGYRRETSPMSIASACDVRQRNFNRSYYGRGMSSQRSAYNGRGGSPMSVRSIDSNATISAKDIAMALNTTQFNKYDMRIIKEAYKKIMKQKSRNRIEKRRNRRLFHKGYRRKSGYDSGELGSNSSISSDDNRSTMTSNYKSNISRCMATKTDVSDFRRTIKESNILKDCTDNFRQNRMHTMVGRPTNLNTSRSSVSSRSMVEKPFSTKSMPPSSFNKTQSFMTQKDRIKNGFLLPSQRFNRSVAGSSIPEDIEKPHSERNLAKNAQTNKHKHITKNLEDLNSDDEEIFSEVTAIEKPPINQRKRIIDSDDDIVLPSQKKPKVASPCKNMTQSFRNSTVIEKAQNDFVFAKPTFPVRKSVKLKTMEKIISKSANIDTTTEMLVSKSRALLSDSIIQPTLPQNPISYTKEDEKDDVEDSGLSKNTTDLSMRPSFIKRKLFTQKMDVTENKANDILSANSPQNSVYGAIQKEKNKARKLVTSQYCLSRDIQSDENNLLDLIHKIVPADRMNATNQTNKTVAINNLTEDDDKWDVTSIISTRNNDEDVSDTFTDEDLLNAENGKSQSSPKMAKNGIKSPKGIAKKVRKSPPKVTAKKMTKSPAKVIIQNTQKVLTESNSTPKKVQKYVKSFWDDIESDAEGSFGMEKQRRELKENHNTEIKEQAVLTKPAFKGFSTMFPSNKTLANNSSMNNTLFNNTNRNIKLCSHRNTKPNLKKTVSEKKKDISYIEPLNTKQRNNTNKNLDLSELKNRNEVLNKTNTAQNKRTKRESKKSPPKKCKTNKENREETPKVTKQKAQTTKQNSNLIVPKNDEKSKPKNNKKLEAVQTKSQDNAETEHVKKSKMDSPKEPETTLNKLQKEPKNKTQNKNIDANNKPQSNKKPSNANNTQNKKNDKKLENKKAETIQQKTLENNNKRNTKSKKTVTKLSDSIIYEDYFTESNNNISTRPVRSCRNSKQNSTFNTSTGNQTLNMSLRSRKNNTDSLTLNKTSNVTEKNKPAIKNTKKTVGKNEQSTLSELSFSLSQSKLHLIKKPSSNVYDAKEKDTSNISFSLNHDKDSPLPKKNKKNSARLLKQAILILTPIGKNATHIKDMYPKNEIRPVRNKLANIRYLN